MFTFITHGLLSQTLTGGIAGLNRVPFSLMKVSLHFSPAPFHNSWTFVIEPCEMSHWTGFAHPTAEAEICHEGQVIVRLSVCVCACECAHTWMHGRRWLQLLWIHICYSNMLLLRLLYSDNRAESWNLSSHGKGTSDRTLWTLWFFSISKPLTTNNTL